VDHYPREFFFGMDFEENPN